MFPGTAHAVIFKWKNIGANPTDTNWTAAASWTNNLATPGYGDTAYFQVGTTGSSTVIITNKLNNVDFIVNSLLFDEGTDNVRYWTDLTGSRLTVWSTLRVGGNVGQNWLVTITNGTLEVGTPTNKATWTIYSTGGGVRAVSNVVAASVIATNISTLNIGKSTDTTDSNAILDLSGATIVGGTFAMDQLFIGGGASRGALTFGSNTTLTNFVVRDNFFFGALMTHNPDGSTDTLILPSNVVVKVGSSGAFATNMIIAQVTNGTGVVDAPRVIAALVTTGGVFEAYARNLIVAQTFTNIISGADITTAIGTWSIHNATGGVVQADNFIIGDGYNASGTVSFVTAAGSTFTNLTVNHNWRVGTGGNRTFGSFTALTNMAVKIGSSGATATNLMVGVHSQTDTFGGSNNVSGTLIVSNGTVEAYLRNLIVGTNASTIAGSSATGLLNLHSSTFVGGGLITSNMVVGGGLNATGTVFFGSGSAVASNLVLAAGSRINLNNTIFGVAGYLDRVASSQGSITGTGLFVNLTSLGSASGPGFGTGIIVSNPAGSSIYATNLTLNLAGGLVNQGVVRIGAASTNVIGSATSGVFTNDGVVRLLSTAIEFANASVLIISNGLVGSGSVITNDGGTSIIRFGTTSATNSGTMQFFQTASHNAANTRVFELSVGSISNNFFVNNGTWLMGGNNGVENNSEFFSVINQFVNNGTLTVTNAYNAPDSEVNSRPFLLVTGSTGGASTNTGTIRLVSTAPDTGGGGAPFATMIFSNGGFVNTGTISANSLRTNSSSGPGVFQLNEAGTVFSNAVGGQLILESTGSSGQVFAVRAAHAVNLGTNLINAGTLVYQTAAGGSHLFTNKGVVAVNTGGSLTAALGIINSNGLIRTTSGTGTVVHAVANLPGATLEASGGRLMLLVSPNQLGNIVITNNGAFQVGNPGTLVWTNAGNIFMHTGTIDSGNLTNTAAGQINGSGTINPGVHNLGLINATNGNLTLVQGLIGTTNSGTLRAQSDGNLVVGSSSNLIVNNASLINLLGGQLLSGDVTNQVGATVSGAGTVSGRLINFGTVDATNGNLVLNSGITNVATVNVRSGGTLTVGSPTLLIFTNYATGQINMYGGTIVDSELVNFGHIASVDGGGLISNALINMAGAFIDATNGTLVLTPDLQNHGTVTNSAVLQIGTAGDGGITNSSTGLIAMIGGTLSSGDVTNFGTVTGFGTLSGRVINSSSVFVTNGTLTAVSGITNATPGTIWLRSTGTLAGGPVTNLGVMAALSGGNVDSAVFNASGGVILATNGALRMSGDVINDGLAVIGTNASGGATLSNNNLYVTGTGAIQFRSSSSSPDTLTVAGVFSNSASTVVTNFGGGFSRLLFSNTSNIASNNGTMQFTAINAGSALQTGVVFQVGIAGSLNTLYNGAIGTVLIGNAGSIATRYYVFSNQLVNAGSFAITNNAASGTNFVFVTGTGTGAAITNEATGTLKMVIGTGAGERNVLTNAGDLVNLGTISGDTVSGASERTNSILLTAGSVFSNAPGGQVNVSGSSAGALLFRADTAVNAGTNSVNAGTLIYQDAAGGGAGVFRNSGNVFVNDAANLNSAGLVVNSGLIRLTNANATVGAGLTNSGTLTMLAANGTGFRNTNTVTTGPLVNTGTLLSDTDGTAAARSNLVVVAAAGQTFSNAVGGQVIVQGRTDGQLVIRADTVQNLGTNLVTAGTVVYQDSTGAANVFTNKGLVTLNTGGNLRADGGVINSNGLIQTTSGTGTVVSALSNLSGATLRADGGTLVLEVAPTQQGSVVVTNAGTYGGTLRVGATGALDWSNAGDIRLHNGTLISSTLTNLSGGVVYAKKIATISSSLINLAGGLVTANLAQATMTGAFTNLGTFAAINSIVTFQGPVVNAGQWNTDPTTNIFLNSYTVAGSGTINMGAGDVYIFSNDFTNLSTQSNTFNTLQGKFLFNAVATTQRVYLAGKEMGLGPTPFTPTAQLTGNAIGFTNNFALGTFEIANFSTVRVSDAFSLLGPGPDDGQRAAIYIRDLFMSPDSYLLIDTNVTMYFVNSNSWSALNYALLNGGELHQLNDPAIIPEPSLLLLLATGSAAIGYARRKNAAPTKRV